MAHVATRVLPLLTAYIGRLLSRQLVRAPAGRRSFDRLLQFPPIWKWLMGSLAGWCSDCWGGSGSCCRRCIFFSNRRVLQSAGMPNAVLSMAAVPAGE
jgi:hypothetical protein